MPQRAFAPDPLEERQVYGAHLIRSDCAIQAPDLISASLKFCILLWCQHFLNGFHSVMLIKVGDFFDIYFIPVFFRICDNRICNVSAFSDKTQMEGTACR